MKTPLTPSGSRPSGTSSPALDWAVTQGKVDQVFACVEAKLRRRRQRRLSAVGALGVLLITGIALWRPLHQSTDRADVSLAITAPDAAASVPRQETLTDGTVVELRDGAELTVAFTADLRRVRLEHGEAHFQVAKNPARPFVVDAGGVDVRAVGTAFSVQVGAAEVEVIVTEGQVAVEKPAVGMAPESVARLHSIASVDAGNRIVVERASPTAAVPVVAITSAEIVDRLAWRVPRLELSGTPLAQAVAFFNRHSGIGLVLASPDLGKLQLSGSLRADNVEPLLRLLQTEFGVEAEHRPGEILLHPSR